MDLLKKAIVSFGGLGYLPIAPGTWGTGGAAVMYSIIRLAGVDDWLVLMIISAFLALIFTLVTAYLGGWAEKYYKKKDPGPVVTDEVAGFFVSVMLFVNGPWWLVAAAGFFTFRFFDILKPPPASWVEKISGGWGIALDDVLAGVYALMVNNVLLFAYGSWMSCNGV